MLVRFFVDSVKYDTIIKEYVIYIFSNRVESINSLSKELNAQHNDKRN